MEELYPYYCAHLISSDNNTLIFRLEDREVTITSNKKLILKIIDKSMGIEPVNRIAQEIAKSEDINVEHINAIINDLVTLGILIDSRTQMLVMHKLTCNPSIYYQKLNNKKVMEIQINHPSYMLNFKKTIKNKMTTESHFIKLLKQRQSWRNFANHPIQDEKLFSICKSSYDFRIKPVASAGNLTPLSIFIIILHGTNNIPRGIYQYDIYKGNLNQIRDDVTDEELIYAFNDEKIIFGAPCIFVISADLKRHMLKYSNRGYRFTLLEVGHVLQNITIEALEQGIESLEYGGFKDKALAKIIGLPNDILPIACEAFGYSNEGNVREENIKIDFDNFEENLINKLKIVDNVTAVKDNDLEDSYINVVVSHYNKAEPKALRDKDRYGTGISKTFFNAATKSLMESYERYTCGKFYYDVYGNEDEIKEDIMDVKLYYPYDDNQIKRLNLEKYNKKDKTYFLRGYTSNNKTVLVPVDYCFFPLVEENVGRKLLHHANSSGCAAHFDLEEAKKSAVAELIERDALMKTWLLKKTPLKINKCSLNLNIQNRIERYENKGFSINILLLSNKYAFSVLACATREDQKPYFVSGASTSFNNISEAIEKAFNEMEYSVLVYTNSVANNNESVPLIKDVCTPVDHGALYAYENHLNKINFLFNGDSIEANAVNIEKEGQLKSLDIIFLEYRPIMEGVHVVRAFSKELIPINFGYGSDFYCHNSIRKRIKQYDEFPHFFA